MYPNMIQKLTTPSAPKPAQKEIAPKSYTWYYPQNAKCVKRYIDMMDSPHLLIAGQTGSGKSTLLNGILYSALAMKCPAEAMFVLIDVKHVELSPYKKLPHVWKFVTEADDVPSVLHTINRYMDSEYTAMEQAGIRKSTSTHIYIVIDELADLLMSAHSRDIKYEMQRILQKGRAANIHIIACTQSPSRKTLPAELVINFTNRIALPCVSAIESRQIINKAGAEKLKGYGTALYMSPMKEIETLTGIPVFTDAEIKERIDFWVNQDGEEQDPRAYSDDVYIAFS